MYHRSVSSLALRAPPSILLRWMTQACLASGSGKDCSQELYGSKFLQVLQLGIPYNHHRNYGSAAATESSIDDLKHGVFIPETYIKYDSIFSTYNTKLKEELPPEKFLETSAWLSDFLKRSKDDEEYDLEFVRILRRILILKEKKDYYAIRKVFHTQFLPIFSENKHKIMEKMKYEIENKMKNMRRLPRIHYVIFNEYLNALSKSHQSRKISVTLQRMENHSPFLPTPMHVITALQGLIDDPSKTFEAATLLERYKNRFNNETGRYVQACLYVLHGLDQSGSFNEAVSKTAQDCHKSKELTMAEHLIQKFLSKIDDPGFPFFARTKEKLITAMIGYYAVIGDKEQVHRYMSKLSNLDSKFYLTILKQLYLNGKSYETLVEYIKQIPSHLRNDYHYGYLIRACADQREFKKAREAFYKSPRSGSSINLYSQIYLENQGKESVMEALTIYDEMLKHQRENKTSRPPHNGEATLYLMKILDQGGFNSQLETFFESLHTPSVPHWLLMARYYAKHGKVDKLLQAKAAIKAIRPLQENII
ncbi:hypothetical protein C9374_008444 [Naegleria lovaniensis]|uniref:Uncharacterized protein n=1 Tax=Naegleria lovaniensis TaxID=51637 RepID=A0AA88GJF9_NAELO|nr:uncharacterized protein C9374_008444 [Naegleria lovaniensis]KAG2378301.1 hypothetical protein C9374_008444 [Naegleria lovaniensis]